MPEIDPVFAWLVLGILLALAELATGAMVLLALGAAAVIVAGLAALGIGLTGQLVSMAVLSGALVPVAVRWIRPRFSPRAAGYGTTGAGTEEGRVFTVSRRDFDGIPGVVINGDFYRVRVETPDTGGAALPVVGHPVRFLRFDGTTAVVVPAHDKEEGVGKWPDW